MPAKSATTTQTQKNVAATTTPKPILKALHVTLENKPGFLAKITRALAENKINIEAVEAEILGKSGFFRFYTETPAEAERILRQQGLVTIGMDVIEVRLDNKPGELARMCATLATSGINIESTFGSNSGGDSSTFYLRVDKPQEAHRILSGASFQARRTK